MTNVIPLDERRPGPEYGPTPKALAAALDYIAIDLTVLGHEVEAKLVQLAAMRLRGEWK